jgi:predicted nucleotidyltransferase
MIHNLPDLPQLERLPNILMALGQDTTITAIWLGGSLAHGLPDKHSDIDLRLAVSAEHFSTEQLPDALRELERQAVMIRRSGFGEGTAWHYLMLPDASIWDVLIYRDNREPFLEYRRVIQARGEWIAKLEGGSDPSLEFPVVEAQVACAVIEQFWLDWRKHAKVLARGRQNVMWLGLNLSRHQLTRIKFMVDAERDCGPIDRLTIHSLMPVSRALHNWSAETQSLEDLANEVPELGRILAHRVWFDYPEAVERAARQALWRE